MTSPTDLAIFLAEDSHVIKSFSEILLEPQRAQADLFDLHSEGNYDVIMKAQIIQIGNSQGVRIPKILLQDCRISGQVELEPHADGILIRNISKPRGDWPAIFKSLEDSDEDTPVVDGISTKFEDKEWKW